MSCVCSNPVQCSVRVSFPSSCSSSSSLLDLLSHFKNNHIWTSWLDIKTNKQKDKFEKKKEVSGWVLKVAGDVQQSVIPQFWSSHRETPSPLCYTIVHVFCPDTSCTPARCPAAELRSIWSSAVSHRCRHRGCFMMFHDVSWVPPFVFPMFQFFHWSYLKRLWMCSWKMCISVICQKYFS